MDKYLYIAPSVIIKDMNQETESYLFCNHQSRTKKNVLPVGKDIKSIVLLQK